MSPNANPERLFRFGVFYIWIVTITVAIAVLLLLLQGRGMAFKEVQSGYGHLMEVLTPQISIMVAFLFHGKGAARKMVTKDPQVALAAVILCCIYHSAMIFCLIFGVLLGRFGSTFDENMDVLLAVAGYLAIIGSAPVAYLFGASSQTKRIDQD
jgi:hypothetical protein